MSMRENAATPRQGLTRTEVAARLGLSTSSVRRLEGAQLYPVQDDRGVWRFDPVEVDRMSPIARAPSATRPRRRAQSPGDIAARVFRLLDAGHDLTEIVVRARQTPALV